MPNYCFRTTFIATLLFDSILVHSQLLCSIEKAVWKLAQSCPSTEANMYHYKMTATYRASIHSFMKVTSPHFFILFWPFSWKKALFRGVPGGPNWATTVQNMPLGVVKTGEKENLLAHQKWACASNFCEPNFQEFRLKWWRKELFLHCGDELNGLRPSWMVLTHGNVIFDTLEPSVFQKCSICWVFQAFFY